MLYLKAYQAYQKNDFDIALQRLKAIDEDDTKKLDLLAQIHFQKKEYQKAYDIYQELLKKDDEYTQERKDNVQTLIACAQLEKPGELKVNSSDKPPSPEEVVEQVEMLNLKDKTVQEISIPSEPTKSKNRHKKRKIRLPKQYDPVAGPDPERWLPRRDRSRNQKKKNRRLRPNQRGGKNRGK